MSPPSRSPRQRALYVAPADAHRADEPVYEWRDEVRRRVYAEHEFFDRVAFARRVLDALRPPRLSVLLRQGFRELRLEYGERWDRPGHAWACLAIPPNASREEIVFAMLELVGAKDDPYWSDVLLRLPTDGY